MEVQGRSGTQVICRITEAEAEEFKALCVLWGLSANPMYMLRLEQEFGPNSWRALRDADMQGNA